MFTVNFFSDKKACICLSDALCRGAARSGVIVHQYFPACFKSE